MSIRKARKAEPGWPEHWQDDDEIGADEFLERAQAKDALRTAAPEDAPWDLQEWQHAGPKAHAFFHDDAKIIAMRGPVGSGKTTAHLRSRFRRAMQAPRSLTDGVRRYKVVIARATYRQLWQTTIPSWWEIMPKSLGHWAGGRGDPVTHTLMWEDAFGRVEFTAEFLAFGESPAEIQANMRGLQTTDLALEEADTCHTAVLTVGSGRINRYPARSHFVGYRNGEDDYGQISMTYNATDIDNWIVKTVERDGTDSSPEAKRVLAELDKAGIRISFYRQPGYGEPGMENTAVLPASYYPAQIATMRAAGKTDDIERLVYNRNSMIVAGDLVFANDFNRRIHVADAPLEPWPGIPLRLGFDQGLYGAAVIGQFVGPYRWQILDEFWLPERIFAKPFGQKLKRFLEERYPGMPIESAFGDVAGEQEASTAGENAVWNRIVGDELDLYIEPQTLGANRITPRLEAVRAGLAWSQDGETGLLISSTCSLLIRGFMAQYVWKDEDRNGKTVKVPNKNHRAADAMDALQYLMLSESVQEGTNATSDKRGPEARLAGHNGGPPLDDMPPASSAYDPYGVQI